MVKGLTRRVVVLNAPDQKFFEQAIFIVRNDAPTQGVSSQALVEEARWLAKAYAAGDPPGWAKRFVALGALVHALCGGAIVGLVWLCWALAW